MPASIRQRHEVLPYQFRLRVTLGRDTRLGILPEDETRHGKRGNVRR